MAMRSSVKKVKWWGHGEKLKLEVEKLRRHQVCQRHANFQSAICLFVAWRDFFGIGKLSQPAARSATRPIYSNFQNETLIILNIGKKHASIMSLKVRHTNRATIWRLLSELALFIRGAVHNCITLPPGVEVALTGRNRNKSTMMRNCFVL